MIIQETKYNLKQHKKQEPFTCTAYCLQLILEYEGYSFSSKELLNYLNFKLQPENKNLINTYQLSNFTILDDPTKTTGCYIEDLNTQLFIPKKLPFRENYYYIRDFSSDESIINLLRTNISGGKHVMTGVNFALMKNNNHNKVFAHSIIIEEINNNFTKVLIPHEKGSYIDIITTKNLLRSIRDIYSGNGFSIISKGWFSK